MSWLDIFRTDNLSRIGKKSSSAQMAKERLQIVVAHQRAGQADHPAYLPQLQQDLVAVLRKYIDVGDDAVQMNIEREGDLEVLELNIILPDARH